MFVGRATLEERCILSREGNLRSVLTPLTSTIIIHFQVLTDDGQTTLATLQEGAVFGELSILNIAGSKQGNRRSANIRSVGYADLFTLSKDNLWEALREYPDARRMLIQKGRELLRKDNLLDESAPEENKTAEELAIELQTQLTFLQTKYVIFFVNSHIRFF